MSDALNENEIDDTGAAGRLAAAGYLPGDVVGYIFGQPGNDTTYLVLTDVREADASAYDCTFDFTLESVRLDQVWRATERELDSSIGFQTNRRTGSYSVRQLAEEAKAKLGL